MRKLCVMLAALLALLAFGARAETPATPVYTCGDYAYVLTEDGSAEIVCWMGEETALEVPGALDGRTVVGVGEHAFENCAELMSVALPDGVQSVYLRFCGGGASNQGPAGAIASIRFICD